MNEVLEYDIEAITLQKPVTMRPPSTVQEYLAMPEGAPYFQFINGEPIEMAAPSLLHQKIIRRLLQFLGNFVDEHELGELYGSPIDVYFSEKNYFEPDIVFVSHKNSVILSEKYIQGAPDLVIEVLSPSTGYYDLSRKKNVYEQKGVREYWLIYPEERRFEILSNSEQGFMLHSQAVGTGSVQSAVLNGLSVSIDAVFR